MVRQFPVLIWLFIAVFLPVVGAGGKVESIGKFTGGSASESVRRALEPAGYRVLLEDGNVACEIWLRSGITLRGKTEMAGVSYTEFAESTFIGVISFPNAGKDYRGQIIKPGSYTLRYALLPNDGNHLGAAPTRDFLLLLPLSADQDPNAQLQYEDLVSLSKKASGTTHPATLSLDFPGSRKEFPAVVENSYGHVMFVAKLKTSSGNELPLAIVVKGEAEQ